MYPKTVSLIFRQPVIGTTLQFLCVQFPCSDLSGEQMYEPFWDAVGIKTRAMCDGLANQSSDALLGRLEQCGLKVVALICDGLAANQ